MFGIFSQNGDGLEKCKICAKDIKCKGDCTSFLTFNHLKLKLGVDVKKIENSRETQS